MTTKPFNSNGRQGLKLLIVFALVIALLPVGAMAIVHVGSPMVIEEAGEYQLVNDITNYEGVRWQNGTDFYEPCIKILASDVIFDGNGYTISGKFDADRDDQVGIYVDSGLERVSVINTKVDGFNYGIYYYGVNQFAVPEMGGRIDNNNVNNNDMGIVLDATTMVSVLNNEASNTRYFGIMASSSDYNIINNNIANNNGDAGIFLAGSNSNIVQLNSANNNINAGVLLRTSYDNTIQQNTANENINISTSGPDAFGDGIILYESPGNRILYNDAARNHISGITVYPVSQGEPNIVQYNNVWENGHNVGDTAYGWGIYVDSDSGTTHVNYNHAFDNTGIGIELHQDNGALSEGNLVEGNGVMGILLHGSKGNTLDSNTVRNNHKYGIQLATVINENLQYISSDNNILRNNEIYGHEISGVYLNGTDNFEPLIENRLEGNDIYDNGQWGVHLYHSNLNTLTDNIIRANGILGIKLDGSAYNVIYNNIFNNSLNAGFGQLSNNPNTWNVLQDPGPNLVGGPYKGGNYWAQPNGQGWSQINPDTKGNGFCDNAFVIGPGNVDNFPLMNPLVVGFTASPTSGDAPLTVNFAGTVGSQAGNNWLWDFGDGTTDATQNPTHIYQSNGIYSVSLTASNAGWSNTTTKTGYIMVGIAPPVPDFTGTPVTGTFPLTVFFNDQSTPNSGQYAVTVWDWNFGDSTTHSNLQNPTHVYQTAGTYDVKLTVTSPGGTEVITKTAYITPSGTPLPTAGFTMDKNSGAVPLTIHFIDQSTGSPPMTYTWDFDDQGYTSEQQNPDYTFENLGTYHVKLTINNAAGSSEVTHDVHVGPIAPPTAAFTAVPPSGTVPLLVSFVDQSTGEPTSWYWSFGDGLSSAERNPTHLYTTSSTVPKTATLIVTNAGGSTSESHPIVVNAPSPVVASFVVVPPSSWIEPVELQFIDTSTGGPKSWYWDFNDPYAPTSQKTSTLTSPKHTYTKAGNYTPTLTVSNSLGINTKIYEGIIYIRHTPPVADFSAYPTNGNAPLSVTFTDNSSGQAITNWQWNFGDGSFSTYTTKTNPVHIYSNQGVYSVTLQAFNDGGWSIPAIKWNYITATAPIPVSPDIITLYNGWNFVSSPKKLATGNNTFQQVFGNVQLAGHSILLYNTTTGLWQSMGPGVEIKPLDGYWIWSNAATPVQIHLAFTGDIFPQNKALKTGWNAIGFSGTTQASASDFLSSLGTSWDRVIGYYDGSNPDVAIIRTSTDPAFSPNRLMKPTHGYWILMNNNGTLQGLA